MAAELGHEALAERHDLAVGLALGVEVRAALAAAHGQRGKGVLEDLLEAQELEDREVHGRVEAQAALVGANSGVELDAVAAVHLDLALVVNPGHAEHDDALGLDKTLEKRGALILGVSIERRLQRGEDLLGGLDELGLVGVALLQLCNDPLGIRHEVSCSSIFWTLSRRAVISPNAHIAEHHRVRKELKTIYALLETR